MSAFSVIIFGILNLSNISNAGTKSICQRMFGEESAMTYEPIEANRGVIVTHSLTSPPDIKRKAGVPLPKGFRCVLSNLDENEKVCPAGMDIDKKRNGRPICLSKEFPIRELCPTEINDGWPGLSEKICKPIK